MCPGLVRRNLMLRIVTLSDKARSTLSGSKLKVLCGLRVSHVGSKPLYPWIRELRMSNAIKTALRIGHPPPSGAEPKTRRGRRSHIPLPRFPLIAQAYLWGLIALGILLLIISVSTWLLVNAQAYSLIDNETQNVLDSFESELSGDTNSLVLFGKWLASPANNSILQKSVSSPDSTKALQTLLEMENLDFITVTDDHGHVLAAAGSPLLNHRGDDLSSSPDIAEALAGRLSTHAEVDASGHLAVKLAVPLSDAPDASTVTTATAPEIATLSLGFYVDESYLQDVRKKSRFDMALVVISKDQLDASMLAGRGASPQLAQIGTGGLNLNGQNLSTSQMVTLTTNKGPYLYHFRPLSIPSRSRSIVIGSGVPTAVLDSERQGWLQTFGWWFLAGLVDLAVVGLIMTRNLAHPLKEMSGTVQRIGDGDWHNRIVLRRDDEFGDLALVLENMRRELVQKIEDTTFEKDGASATIDAMPIPIVVTDPQNRITTVNHAAEALLGFKAVDLASAPWPTLFSLPDGMNGTSGSNGWPSAGQLVDEQHSMVGRRRLALNTGARPVLDISSVPVHVAGELLGYVHTLQDVSEIDRFAKAKNEFLLSVAHELEGPLASWRASVELLLEDYGEMTRTELGLMLRTLQKTAIRFQGLVEALVDIGKLEAGKFRIQPTPVSYERLIKDSISQIEPVLQRKGQNLRVETDAVALKRVMADRTRIGQVIINLVRNASKYSPDGEPILVTTRTEAGRLFFQVTDRGSGIDPEEQEHIFERYYRSKRVEEDGAGIGLGLALAKAIIQAHGGEIGVTSELGKGATFWFSLAEIRSEQEGVNEGSSSGR